MNLDSRVRSAVEETATAPLDIEGGLAGLPRTRRRRAATKVGAGAVAAAVVVAGVALSRHEPGTTPEPAPAPPSVQLHGDAVLALTPAGAVTQVRGHTLAALPPTVAPQGPFRFSHDGASLVYATGGSVHRVDLRSGSDQSIGACPDADCRVAYNEDLTQTATAEGRAVVVDTTDGSGRPSRIPLGAPASDLAWSPGSGSLAYTTEREGRATLEVVDVETGDISRRVQLVAGDTFLGSPAWSPDGHQIAYVIRFGSLEHSVLISLWTVTTIGAPLSTDVHEIDRCLCTGYAPGIAWSPDVTRLMVTGTGRAQVAGGAIWSVQRDGSQWHREVRGVFSNGLAWQPPVTAQP